MQVFLKLGARYIGISPNSPDQVYTDRVAGGAWEEVSLTPHDGGRFDARFVAANRQLSLTPTGMQPRPAGTFGAWELLFATAQPDGSNLLYRTDQGVLVGPVLTIEEAP